MSFRAEDFCRFFSTNLKGQIELSEKLIFEISKSLPKDSSLPISDLIKTIEKVGEEISKVEKKALSGSLDSREVKELRNGVDREINAVYFAILDRYSEELSQKGETEKAMNAIQTLKWQAINYLNFCPHYQDFLGSEEKIDKLLNSKPWLQGMISNYIQVGDERAIQKLCSALELNTRWAHDVAFDLLENLGSCESILKVLLRASEHNQSWAYHILFSFFKNYNGQIPSKECHYIFESFYSKALEKNQDTLKELLIVFASEFDARSDFYETVRGNLHKILKSHSKFETGFPKNLEKILFRLCALPDEELELRVTEKDESWQSYSNAIRLSAKLLHLRRDQDLISMMCQRPHSSVRFMQSAVPKFFPKSEALLIGHFCAEAKGATSTTVDVGHFLSEKKVSVYTLIREKLDSHEISREGVRCVTGKETAPIWLQDCLMVGEHLKKRGSVLQLPRFTHASDVEAYEIEDCRTERIKKNMGEVRFKPPKMYSLGKTTHDGELLNTLEYVYAINPSLNNIFSQFTFNEGGNVLVGEDEKGLKYALIGKDAVEINKKLLEIDLVALGLERQSDEKGSPWRRTSADRPIKAKLTEDDLKVFFAADLGISDPSKIYFVEQPEFHIDMAMTIVGHKKVILNDSLASHRLYSEYLSSKKATSQEKISSRDMKILEKEAHRFNQYELVAMQDLIDQGFTVVRVPGRFRYVEHEGDLSHIEDRINFFNFTTLHTQEGKNLVLALGSHEIFEERFKELIRQECAVDISSLEFHFLNSKTAQAMLSLGGGIHCMTKRFPTPIEELKNL